MKRILSGIVALCIVYATIIFCLLFQHVVYGDDRIRVTVIDTGVDLGNQAIGEVLCPKDENFDAVKDKYGVGMDLNGHGSNIAGIIRAVAGNKGYCLSVCRFYSEEASGEQNLANEIKCLHFAKDLGAAYINFSGGGEAYDEREKSLIDSNPNKFIVSAGNDNKSLGKAGNTFYPASYGLSNVIVVGALGTNGERLKESNFGPIVELWLPGEGIYSASKTGRREPLSGTSQATAIATGIAIRAALNLPGIGSISRYKALIENFWRAH